MRGARFVAAVLAALFACRAHDVHGEMLTFHLPAREALASVGRYDAFIASLGKRAKGVKLVDGGTSFAGQTCAAFGGVYRLAAVTVLDGPTRLHELVTTHRGKDANALDAVFQIAGVASWTAPPADVETDVPFWTGVPAPNGVRFTASALNDGTDDGLLATGTDPGVLRFRVNVTTPPDVTGHYRFLVQLDGRTSSQDAALVKFAERQCFAFVDLAPLDLSVLTDVLQKTPINSDVRRAALQQQLDLLGPQIAINDDASAVDTLARFTAIVMASAPVPIAPAAARKLVTTAFDVRRGLLFQPPLTSCGNGVRESGEQCDGTDLGGFDCGKLGFQAGTGTLGCTAGCKFDTSGCVANPVCGDGIVEPPEQCDNGAANSDTTPDACRTNCKLPFCGDGVIDSFEDCEGSNLDGETCVSLGFDGGVLSCDPTFCFFNVDRCTFNGGDE